MLNIYQYTHPNGKVGEMKAKSIDELYQRIGEINGWDYKVTDIKHVGTFRGYTMGGNNKNNGATYFGDTK